MIESRIVAIDHVHLEAPFGIEDALRWFYEEVAELNPIQPDLVPSSWNGEVRLIFRCYPLEVRLHLKEEPRIEPVDCRLTIRMTSLHDTCRKLVDEGVRFQEMSGLTWTDRRIGTHDPAGNRVEFRQHWPYAPL